MRWRPTAVHTIEEGDGEGDGCKSGARGASRGATSPSVVGAGLRHRFTLQSASHILRFLSTDEEVEVEDQEVKDDEVEDEEVEVEVDEYEGGENKGRAYLFI